MPRFHRAQRRADPAMVGDAHDIQPERGDALSELSQRRHRVRRRRQSCRWQSQPQPARVRRAPFRIGRRHPRRRDGYAGRAGAARGGAAGSGADGGRPGAGDTGRAGGRERDAELGQQFRGVGDPAGRGPRLAVTQHQRSLRHHRRRLRIRVVRRGQVMEHRPRRRHDPGRRQRVDGDVVLIQLGGQPGREPLDRGLAHPVHRPPRPGRAPGGRLGCRAASEEMLRIQPAAALAHPRQDQRGQVEGRLHLHVEHERVALGGEVLDPAEVGDRRVVDQDVRRPELAGCLGDQALAVAGPGPGPPRWRPRSRPPPGSPGRLADRPLQRRLPGPVVRAATATAAPSAANRRAISAPMPRLAPVTMATFPSSTRACPSGMTTTIISSGDRPRAADRGPSASLTARTGLRT